MKRTTCSLSPCARCVAREQSVAAGADCEQAAEREEDGEPAGAFADVTAPAEPAGVHCGGEGDRVDECVLEHGYGEVFCAFGSMNIGLIIQLPSLL